MKNPRDSGLGVWRSLSVINSLFQAHCIQSDLYYAATSRSSDDPLCAINLSILSLMSRK